MQAPTQAVKHFILTDLTDPDLLELAAGALPVPLGVVNPLTVALPILPGPAGALVLLSHLASYPTVSAAVPGIPPFPAGELPCTQV